jgi:hypothetical protein
MDHTHLARFTRLAWGLLLIVALLALPAPGEAAPAPEETALSSPWFPETVSAGCAGRKHPSVLKPIAQNG